MRLKTIIIAALLLSAPPLSGASAVYLGKTSIPGTAEDFSGLTDVLQDGTPHNRLGGIGSGIDFTGKEDLYVLCPDRGPADGATDYKCRLQLMKITVYKNNGKWEVKADLKSTIMLSDSQGRPYIGSSKAIADGLRFDPEGIRVSMNGTYYISDEYGPLLLEFDAAGKSTGRKIPIPERFLAANPSASHAEELSSNKKGRQPNRGMEGLAISPDGNCLFGIMQSPLIQDGALDASGKRIGKNIRILRIDLKTLKTEEYVFVLENSALGASEILALNNKEFLVIERDGKSGANARFKKIVKADISKASDVSAIDELPSEGLPEGVVPVEKKEFIDLLDSRYGLAGDDFPEKIEGLAFGPRLPDGRRLLLITSDNDFIPGTPSVIYAFALDG